MDATIVGSGAMARGIATRFAAAGAPVQILARKPENARSLAEQLTAQQPGSQITAGTLGGDRITGDIVVPYAAVIEIAQRIADEVPSRIVVDITNPVDFSTFDGLVVPPDGSAAQEIEKLLPDASVVKAFNTTFASTLLSGKVAGQPLDVLIASDDPGAVKVLSDLVAGESRMRGGLPSQAGCGGPPTNSTQAGGRRYGRGASQVHAQV